MGNSVSKSATRLSFSVPGDPQALQRARSTRFVRRYDPPANKSAKAVVQQFALEAARNAGIRELFDGPITLQLDCSFARPRSHYGTGRNASRVKSASDYHHTSGKDVDNLVKLVCDALNGVLWKDDVQVFTINATKRWTTGAPTTIVTIEQVCTRAENRVDRFEGDKEVA